ncbi:MAG: Rpn family recombination-promoting nuclease/putative transposase [Treponema sp.]|jgi:hypothetical protein|nr:Rpn family recombination-promoting nuclease/putative transposase [Treponema sp.]
MGANREFKSTVFSLLFSEPDILRELYGALKGFTLPPDTPVVVNTLEGALFRNMLNDVSFEIGGKEVVVIEHQSSVNPNMPLRILMYIARLYEKMTAGRKAFGGKQVKIPRPEFIVLYNGVAPYPEEDILRLSDAFEDASSPGTGRDAPPELELVVKVYNINRGHNAGKLRQSRTLEGYSEFIGKVREMERPGEELTGAIKKAMEWCISQNILKDFFERNGSEVINMLFNEFNMEAELAAEWEAGLEKGMEEGLEKTARNALAEGLPMEVIRKITGLDLETISQLSSQ